jgi:uncharacterized protein (TIGR02231 family)
MDIGHRAVRLGAILLLGLAGPGIARAAEVRVEQPGVAGVTVFPDRAQVTRRVSVTLPAGASEVVFEKIPPGIERDSVRVAAQGVPALIGAVEVRERAQEAPRSPEFAAAESEVRRLEIQLATIEAEEAADKEMAEHLRALRATTGTRAGERLGEARPDPEAVRALFAFVRAELDDLGTRAVARQERRRAAQEQLQVARARRDAARPRGPIRVRTVGVAVETRQAGPLELTLTYVVPGAGWRPTYRAVLDADRSEVVLTAEAVVAQRTGEDWDDVTVALSTAAPARGVQPPQLQPVALRPAEPRAKAAGAGGGAFGSANVAAGAPAEAQGRLMQPPPAAPPAAQPVDAERREAEVVHTAYNATFAVPGRSTIPADGREHRVVLRTQALAATLGYRVVPAAREEAFVVARAAAPADYPLLAGRVRVFAGAAYVGQFAVEETGPGAEVELPFGADNRVRVKRVTLPPRRTREGLTGRDQQVAYGFRTEIENLRDRPVTVVVEDQVPVSEDERITVKRGDPTTAGVREVRDRPGVLEWDVTLGPRQKKEIALEYAVRFPRDLPVGGLR